MEPKGAGSAAGKEGQSGSGSNQSVKFSIHSLRKFRQDFTGCRFCNLHPEGILGLVENSAVEVFDISVEGGAKSDRELV